MPAVKKRKKAEPVTLNNKSNGKGFFSKNMFIVLAFVIPFVLMTAAFGVMKVSPFGDNQILVTDLWHQYYPFLAVYAGKSLNTANRCSGHGRRAEV